MTSPAAAPQPPADGPSPRSAEADRWVLPDQTGDDLDVGWGERADDTADDDERFLRERPPHWE